MTGQLFISLLNPGIDLLFAAAFFWMWRQRREHYIAYAAAAYFCSAIAFLCQDVAPVLPMEAQRIPANLGFLLTGAFFAAAIVKRYALPVPWRAMAAVGGIAMAIFLWFLLVQPDISTRIYAISIGAGLIAAMVVRALWPVSKPFVIDKLLFGVAALSAVNLIVRPIILLALRGGFDSYAGFQQSLYWTTVQFSQAMVSIVAAICLMVAVAIDMLRELKVEANADDLSGLLNRRGFEANATAALRRCADEARAAALLVADLDHFKRVNDRHGHAVGDMIIATFGAHVRQLGPADMVAGRIGGEEIAVLLPGASIETARRLAEIIRIGFPTACAEQIPPSLVPTTSLGITAGRADEGLSELLRQADQALYEAKRAGRNRVRAFSPIPVRLAAGGG